MQVFLLIVCVLFNQGAGPFHEAVLGPLKSHPRSFSVSTIGETLLFWCGTEKNLYLYDEFGTKKLFLPFREPVNSISALNDIALVSSGRNLTLITSNGEKIETKKLPSSIVSVFYGQNAFILTKRTLYRLTKGLNVIWKSKLPFDPDTFVVYGNKIYVSGLGRVMAFDSIGDLLWDFNPNGDFVNFKYMWRAVPILPSPIVVRGNKIVFSFYLDDKGSILYGLNSNGGEKLFEDSLKGEWVLGLEATDNAIFLTSVTEKGLRKGRLRKYDWDGNLVKVIKVPAPFLCVKDVGKVLFMLEYSNNFSIFHYDMNEVWVQGYSGDAVPFFFGSRNKGYLDFLVVQKPVGEAPYTLKYDRNVIPENIRDARSFIEKAKGTEYPERALGLLSMARGILFLYSPKEVEAVEGLMKVYSKKLTTRRKIKESFAILRDAILIFVLLVVITLLIRDLLSRAKSKAVNYDALREIESGFYHDTKRKLKLLASSLVGLGGESDLPLKEDLNEYLREDTEELVRVFRSCKSFLKKANLRRFRIRDFEKGLAQLKDMPNVENVSKLEGLIETLRLELLEHQENIQVVFDRAVESFKRSFRIALKEVDFKVEKGAPLPYKKLWKDHARYLSGIVYNILVNALEAVRETERKEIIASLKKGGRGGNCSTVIAISDSGKGMDEEVLKNFSMKGYSGWDSGGTGLGITEETIEFINRYGEFRVQSEPYKGTKITICL